MSKLRLTDRALSDIAKIEPYSIDRWGERVSDQYMTDLETALDLLEANLSLFKGRHDYVGRLLFYKVRQHVIVGDIFGGVGYVLCVWHAGMDFISRLPKLEPALSQEAELLARQIEEENKRGKE